MQLKDSKTFQNLTNAFAGECMAMVRYRFVSYGATQQGYKALAALVDDVIYNEFQHARMLYTFIESADKGTINNLPVNSGYPFKEKWNLLDNLKFAADDEEAEVEIYSAFAKTAREEGFKDVAGTNIMVFYPSEGVSPMQKQQMQKQEGNNVNVSAIYGNFDDAQSFLKRVFVDSDVNAYADEKGVLFSSANSINIGRLFPQVAYYVSTYVSLVDNGAISEGEIFDVVVPTGNFGNILAGYFAKKMGVPIGKLICASNKNKVLADFFETGVYDMNRQFFTTDSPSMDILLSSNFERFLFYVAGQDAEKVAQWEKDLAETGKMAVSADELAQLRREFEGGWIDDGETEAVINHVYNDYGYLLDPHTAVAYGVYMNRRRQGLCEGRHTVVMATAHPYKFPPVICQALALPKPLAELRNKPVRFGSSIEKEDMKQAVLAFVDAIHGRA